MTNNLATARTEFIAAMGRDTTGAELKRLVEVLDALINWSVAEGDTLSFHTSGAASGVLGFRLVASNAVLWTARVMRGDAPKLEICPPSGRMLSAAMRAKVLETLNANSRSPLSDERGLRIGFGALKNVAARKAVLAQLDELARSAPMADAVS